MNRRRAGWRAALTLAVLLPGCAAAQAPAALAALGGFRDSLRGTRDARLIHALEKQLKSAVRGRDADPVTALRLGFVQLRRGEVEQDRGAFTDAYQTFDSVLAAHAKWSAAWLGRGLARLNLSDNQSAPAHALHLIFSSDPVADAARDFAHTIDSDALYVEGLLKVSDIALQDYHPAHLRAALLALRRTMDTPAGRDPAVQLAHLRVERIAGSADSAERLASALRRRQPDDPVVLLESAHASFAAGDETGADSWFRGLALADSAAAALYRSDLLLLLPDSVMRQFDATTGEERASLVHRYLAASGSGEPRSAGGRLREHYRRLDHAREAFAVRTDRFVADAVVAFQPTGREIDERGLVWVLHGPPDDHTYLNMVGAPPNESWHYKDEEAGGELLFHFVELDPGKGYQRVSSVFDILAMMKPLLATGHGDPKAMAARGEAVQTYGASWTAQTVQDMLYSREAMSPTYGRMLARGKNGALELQQEERATGDSSIVRGETRGEHYELPLDAQLDAVAVGSDSAGQLLQVAFAIPGTSLYAPPSSGPVVYPVRMRVSVIRRGSGQVVAAVDTLRNFLAAAPVPADGMLFGRLPIRVPPGEYSVRIALETPGRGVMGPRQVVRIAGATPQTIDLSDLALGARSIRLPWRTPRGDTLWVNPSRAFRSGEPMQVYFEAVGVAVGSTYKYDLAVFKDGDRQPQLRLGFGATAVAVPDPVHREIDIGRLKAGSYQLQVTITSPSGQQVVRRGEFTVVR